MYYIIEECVDYSPQIKIYDCEAPVKQEQRYDVLVIKGTPKRKRRSKMNCLINYFL